MTLSERTESRETTQRPLRAVLCGSFHRSQPALKSAFHDLQGLDCVVLSPTGAEFVSEKDGFVFTNEDLGAAPQDIERRHLDGIRAADFVWLHDPEGYIGRSAALELGYAIACAVPVFAAEHPGDPGLRGLVRVGTPHQAVEAAMAKAEERVATALRGLQDYYSAVARLRGFEKESAKDTLLLITEEVGELARAVRKTLGIARDSWGDENVGEEIADVQLYLVHLANQLQIDLSLAVATKEVKNSRRYETRLRRSA